jgi:hypothetical protein
MFSAHAPVMALAASLCASAPVGGGAALVAERAAALGRAVGAAALEHIADLPARTGAAIDRASAAIRSQSAGARGRGAASPLTAAAAASLYIAQLIGLAAATVLSDPTRVRDRSAFDLGLFAQVCDRHAALTTRFADPPAATHAALQHLAAAVRHASAHDSLVLAALGDAGVSALSSASIVVRAALHLAGVLTHDAAVSC